MRQTIVPNNFYLNVSFQMGIYALLGVGQALGAFLTGATVAFLVYSASRQMHDVRL